MLPCLALMAGCKEEFIGQTPTDHIPPSPITNPVVQNTYGGATITYTVPTDKDFSFVRAEYLRKGVLCTDHSSVYNNSITVEGFGTTEPVVVKLYSVDFSMNFSEPVIVTIHPLEPYVNHIYSSMEANNDFQGVSVHWKNERKQPISITLLYKEQDSDEAYVEKDVYFTDEPEGNHAFRGLESVPTDFKVFVKDKWDNASDTLSFSYTPLYEVMLDRTKYAQVKLPFDLVSYYNNSWWAAWDLCHDGDTYDYGWISDLAGNAENDFRFPIMTTFDLGTTAKLSRTHLWMRGQLEYGERAFKKLEFWGTEALAVDKPRDYWASDERGSWRDDWTYLGSFETTKPSGPSGVATEDDKLWARANGFEFYFASAPKVRYVRMLVNETWSGGTALELCEIAFMGNDKDE